MTILIKRLSWTRVLTLLAVVALLAMPAVVHAQNPDGQRVQQSKTTLESATQMATNVTSASTTTITPNGGEYIYISSITLSNCAGASAVTAAGVTSLTTTNISGSPAWTVGSGVAAGLCQPVLQEYFPHDLRSQTPGTAVTFVMPTFATNQTLRLNVAYRSAQ